MKLEKIQTYITPQTTGYSAIGALALTGLSGMSKNKNLKKYHKNFAWLSAFFSAIHIGQIEYYKHKFKYNR